MKARKISICLDIKLSSIRNCYIGVSKSFYIALKDKYNVDIIDLAKNASDILLFHNSIDNNNTMSNALHKFMFCHNTMQLGIRADCYYGHYKCIANSEIMRDTFHKKHGHPFEVGIVHNFPNWELRDLYQSRKGIVWLTKLYPHTLSVFREFVDFCKWRGVIPSVVSSIAPPKDTMPFINLIPRVEYCDLEDFLNTFEFGVGIGRSALDMSLCGVKTTVAGIYIPEPIGEDTVENHIKSNFNSILNRSEFSFEEVFCQSKKTRELIMETMSPNRMLCEIEKILEGVI